MVPSSHVRIWKDGKRLGCVSEFNVRFDMLNLHGVVDLKRTKLRDPNDWKEGDPLHLTVVDENGKPVILQETYLLEELYVGNEIVGGTSHVMYDFKLV